MGLHKRFRNFRDWCPQPPNPVSSKLKRYSTPLGVLLTAVIFAVSFSAVSSSNLFHSSIPQVPAPMALSSGVTPPVTQLWSFKPAASQVHSPVMANGLVYGTSVNSASSVTTLYCIDPSTGTQIWNSTNLSDQFILANGYIYIGSSTETPQTPYLQGVVSCLNANTGTQVWNYSYGTSFGEPLENNGIVYVGGQNFIFAFNALDGAKLWNNTAPIGTNFDWRPLSLSGTDLYAVSAVYSDNDSSWHSGVYAFDISTGKQLWNYTTPGQFAYGSFAVDSQNIYISSNFVNTTGQINSENAPGYVYQGGVLALNTSNGAKNWNYLISSTVESPIVANGTVCAVAGNGNIYALDASSGKVTWHRSVGLSTGSVSLVNGDLYVGSSDGVYCFDAVNGETVWHFKASDFADSSATYPTYADGIIYVGWNGPQFFAPNTENNYYATNVEHNFYAINAYNGKMLWNYTLGYTILASPLVANGVIYVPGSFVTTKSPDSEAPGALLGLKPNVAALPSPTPSTAVFISSSAFLIVIGAIVAVIVVSIISLTIFKKRQLR